MLGPPILVSGNNGLAAAAEVDESFAPLPGNDACRSFKYAFRPVWNTLRCSFWSSSKSSLKEEPSPLRTSFILSFSACVCFLGCCCFRTNGAYRRNNRFDELRYDTVPESGCRLGEAAS